MAFSLRLVLPSAVALALLLAACDRGGGSAPAATEPEPTVAVEPGRQVRVELAELGTLTAAKLATVTISAGKESRVASGASGRVDQILARPGTRVDPGTAVVLLADDNQRLQLANAELALESATINLQTAERATSEGQRQLQVQARAANDNFQLAQNQLDEGRNLLAAGGIAATEVSALEAQASQAESSLLQAQDALARSERASDENLALLRVQVRQAQNQRAQALEALSETRIVAPFAGEVTEVFVEEGEFVGAGGPVFRLTGTDDQVATFNVSPEDAVLLQAQGLITLRYAGLDFGAQITRSSMPEQQPRLVTLTASLYPAETPIPNGTVAELRYTVDLAQGALVSSSALSANGGRTFVFVIDGDRARRQEVAVVAESGSQAVIEGIELGTPVISPRPLDVRDGTRVQVIDD